MQKKKMKSTIPLHWRHQSIQINTGYYVQVIMYDQRQYKKRGVINMEY